MSVKTELYISNRFSIYDIKNVIESHLDAEVKIDQTGIPDLLEFYFTLKGDTRLMSVHINADAIIGKATLLRLGSNEEGKEIMLTIAKVTGGLYVPEDTSDDCQMIRGMLSDEDGLPYFIKDAIIHNNMTDNHDLRGLNESIKKWQAKMNRVSVDTYE